MRIKSTGLVLLCFAATAISGQAFAQSNPAAARPSIPTGPPITGLCVLSNDAVLVDSTVGKFVGERLRQLKAQTDAELNAEAQAIKADGEALQAQKASLPAEQYEQRGTAINQRISALQHKAQVRQAELQKTEEKAGARIEQEAEPVVQQAFTQHGCSILLNANSVLFTAPAMDITRQVLTGLDAKITQFPFEREHIDQQPGAQGGQ